MGWFGIIYRLQGDGSDAPSPTGRRPVDGRPVPLASTAAHDPKG